VVWADQLQAAGERLGGLIGLGLRADQLCREALEPELADAVAAELADAIDQQAEALLGRFAHTPGIEFEWQLGVVRAVTVGQVHTLDTDQLLDGLAELVRRPALRYLDHLHINSPQLDAPKQHRAILERLAEPDVIARPRRLVLGSMPCRFRVVRTFFRPYSRPGAHFLDHHLAALVTALSQRGLTWFVYERCSWGVRWVTDNSTDRLQALDQLLASAWTPAHVDRLAWALWDSSLRVRRRVIEAIPELPDDAAPLLLPLLAIQVDGHRIHGDWVDRAVARASARPAWVRMVADNWRCTEPWVATWLSTIEPDGRAEAVAALPRMREQLARATAAYAIQTVATLSEAVDRLSAC
jgi:hypothetical protein